MARGQKTIIDGYIESFSPKYGTYFESFIGGAAVFFNLQPPGSFISDFNPEVVNVYQVLKHKIQALIDDLSRHEISKTYYYQIRNADRLPDFSMWSDRTRAI